MNQNAPWWVTPGLAAMVFLIFAGALAAMCWKGNETQITTMITATVGLAMGAAGFYFGSSAGSARKDDTIAAQGAALATSTPVPPAPAPTNPQP